MVVLKNPCIIEEKTRSKTAINIDSATKTSSEQIGNKWVAEAEVYESEEEDSKEETTNSVEKLLDAIGLFDNE